MGSEIFSDRNASRTAEDVLSLDTTWGVGDVRVNPSGSWSLNNLTWYAVETVAALMLLQSLVVFLADYPLALWKHGIYFFVGLLFVALNVATFQGWLSWGEKKLNLAYFSGGVVPQIMLWFIWVESGFLTYVQFIIISGLLCLLYAYIGIRYRSALFVLFAFASGTVFVDNLIVWLFGGSRGCSDIEGRWCGLFYNGPYDRLQWDAFMRFLLPALGSIQIVFSYLLRKKWAQPFVNALFFIGCITFFWEGGMVVVVLAVSLLLFIRHFFWKRERKTSLNRIISLILLTILLAITQLCALIPFNWNFSHLMSIIWFIPHWLSITFVLSLALRRKETSLLMLFSGLLLIHLTFSVTFLIGLNSADLFFWMGKSTLLWLVSIVFLILSIPIGLGTFYVHRRWFRPSRNGAGEP